MFEHPRWPRANPIDSFMSEALSQWFPTTTRNNEPHRFQPLADVKETDSEIVVRSDMPGVKKEDIKVQLENDVLTISAERKGEEKKEGETWHLRETWHGSYKRAFVVPEGIDPSEIKAGYENGVLTVTVPKPKKPEPKKMDIAIE